MKTELKTNGEVDQINLVGVINATSKKQNEKIVAMNKKAGKEDFERKSIWFIPNSESLTIGINAGLQTYDVEMDDGVVQMFILKAASEMDRYNEDFEIVETIDGGMKGDNFHSDEKEVKLAVLTAVGEWDKRWYTVKGILGDIVYNEKRNLFAPNEE